MIKSFVIIFKDGEDLSSSLFYILAFYSHDNCDKRIINMTSMS